jgi:hypothetical protein
LCALKDRLTITQNNEDELISIRTITGYKMRLDFTMLNKYTTKNHKTLTFMEKILERLMNNSNFCFLGGYLGYSQFAIQPEVNLGYSQFTFTFPLITYAYNLMPFGLCNVAATFQQYKDSGVLQQQYLCSKW